MDAEKGPTRKHYAGKVNSGKDPRTEITACLSKQILVLGSTVVEHSNIPHENKGFDPASKRSLPE
jgi:hypothetical protein